MANAKTPDNRRQRILAFVRDNPGCGSAQVAEAFGMDSRRAGSELEQLKSWGYAVGEKINNRMYWTATGKQQVDTTRGEIPYRPTVKAWPPHMVRHWLDAALFGPAPAQVGA